MMARKKNNKLHSERRAENRAVVHFLLSGAAGVVVLALVVWGVLEVQAADTLPIRNVEVRSEFNKVTEKQIQAVIAQNELNGFFSTDVDAITNDMREIPWLETITIRRVWPDTLQLTVTEKKAIALWNDSALLAVDGTVFSPEVESYPQDLPKLTGPMGTQANLLKNYISMAASLQTLNLQINELSMDERRAWSVKLDIGIVLNLGRKKTNQRLQRFVKIYKDLAVANTEKAAVVDLRYTNGFAIRWENSLKQTALKAQLG
ncbi:MAG: cell division protein FtsQ/DivIB [Sulfuriflexus sp.]|nr:cell division protein FtsQ/DivIB [Sulfuriflexus sp.]